MRPVWTRAAALAGFAFLLHLAARAETPQDKKTDDTPCTGAACAELAPFDDAMREVLREHHIPGGAAAAARDGKIVYARGFGYADLDDKTPVEPDALFRIASISKPVTAAAVLQLAERGKVKLDDKVFDLLALEPPDDPDVKFDKRWKKITLLQLLQHRGGWDRDKSFDPPFRSAVIVRVLHIDPPARPNDMVRYMLTRPLDFEPGSRYAYSNFGYTLLGRVIEKISGMGYEDYVKKEVLAPLGVAHMRLGKTLLKDHAPGEVRYYADGQGKCVLGTTPGKSVLWPYGGWCLESMDSFGAWIACPEDLVRFADAFGRPKECKILNEDSIHTMFAPPPGEEKAASYYACGWWVRPADDGKLNVWHDGSLDGTSGIIARRHNGLAWAVLFNSRASAMGHEPSAAIDALFHDAAAEIKHWPDGERAGDRTDSQ